MFNFISKIIRREVLNGRVYSLLNLLGLIMGLLVFIYIISYVSYESNYDSFHSKADRTYRCVCYAKMGETLDNNPRSEAPLAAAIRSDLPEAEAVTRLYVSYNIYTKFEENKFVEEEIWYADPNVFDVFDLNLLEGDKPLALANPNSILLTKSMAQKYFGSENPMGKYILLGKENIAYKVSGVLEDLPLSSHLQFNFLASFSTLPVSNNNQWLNLGNTYTYVVLKKGVDVDEFEQKFRTSMNKYEEPIIKLLFGVSLKEFNEQGDFFNRELQAIRDIHNNSTFPEEVETYGNPRFLFILTLVGIFVLLMACFNFINLSTARASARTKEIGIKMLLGSSRMNVIYQIMIETFIFCLFALAISLIILFSILPFLNQYSGVFIQAAYFLNINVILMIVSTLLIITILSGTYPAFLISKFKPIDIIKGDSFVNHQKPWIRNFIVSTQVVIFIVLVFSVLMINRQIVFMRNGEVGFEKENVLVLKNAHYLEDKAAAFKMKLSNHPSIISTSFSSTLPSVEFNEGNPFGSTENNMKYFMSHIRVDYDFKETLNIEMLDGRFFTNNVSSELDNVILNEEAANILSWNDSEQKTLYDYSVRKAYNVIGIISNFHMKSLRDKSMPLVIKLAESSDYLSIRVHPTGIVKTLASVKKYWEEFNSNAPYEYFFLDKSFDAQYKSEERLARLIGSFALIAIIIACFGLIGMITFTTNKRTKEIGIRKVNGASTFEILKLLNMKLLIWFLLAFIIACPISYVLINRWLQNFVYRVEISWWVFALTGLIAFAIIIVSVSWQAYKAAHRNPVEALRYE